MNLLESLAGGLRGAAGVLNPAIQERTMVEDQQNSVLDRQQRMVVAQHIQQQVANGSMPPEQGQALLQKLGAPPGLAGGPSIDAQAKMQALQNEKGFREAAASAGGDPEKIAAAAMQFGKPEIAVGLYKSQEDRLTRKQMAADALEAKITQFQMMLENKALDREQRERISQMMDDTKRQGQLVQQQIAADRDATRRMLGAMNQAQRGQMTEYQRQGLELRQQQQVNTQVGQLANHLQQYKIPGLVASVQSANDLLKKYEGGDIPGFGIISGSSKVPNVLRSKEANDVRSAVQAATNDLLNMYSGLAVTLPESERRDLEQMRGGDFTVEDFKSAWPRVVKRLNTVVGNMKASVPPQALQEYQSRPGAMNMNPITPAFQKNDGWTVKEKK